MIVIDEAGLQSNRQGHDVLRLAERFNNRVLFVGDSHQHSSVEAGDFLRLLEVHSKLQSAELRDIRRQTHATYNRAIREMATGRAAVGMKMIDALGWLTEAKEDYLKAAASSYFSSTGQGTDLNRCRLVAPTWAELDVLNHHVRAHLKEAGKLGPATQVTINDPLNWTRQQKKFISNYQPGQLVTYTSGKHQGRTVAVDKVEAKGVVLADGARLDLAGSFDVGRARHIEVAAGDRILLRTNSKEHGLTNGDVWSVKSVENGQITLSRQVKDQQEVRTLPQGFASFCHGYASTSHKSQGATVDRVVVAAATLDAKAAYVGCSRARERCDVFTPDRARLFDHLPRSGDRRAALDVLNPRPTAPSLLARSALWAKDAYHAMQGKAIAAAAATATLVSRLTGLHRNQTGQDRSRLAARRRNRVRAMTKAADRCHLSR